MAAAVFVFTTITLTEAPTPCPLPAAIPPVIPVYFSEEAAKTKMSPFVFMTVPFPICAQVVLLLTNTWMTPSPDTEMPLLLSIRRNTSSYQNRSYAQITVRTDGHITGHVSGHVSIRIHCTSGFHVLAKSCLHCHVVYNRADGHSGALAATVRHRTGDHCRVHFGSGRYFQSIGQYQHHTISNQRSTVSSMTRTVKEPAPVKLLPTVDADPPTASR